MQRFGKLRVQQYFTHVSLNLKTFKFNIFYWVQCALLYIENDAEILPVRYTRKVAEKEFKMALIMNKLAMINSCEITIEK